jgi:hypothetical protein
VLFGDPTARDGSSWRLATSIARNRSTLEALGTGTDEVALAPSMWGATLTARTGEPLGVIMGSRQLRDSTGALILRNGLPIADAIGGVVLGSVQPDWSVSLTSQFRLGAVELDVLFDARMGGEVFSATNRWGSYAGSLESTLRGRESGMVVAGVDSVTGTANADSVSTQDYFHALGGIVEPWVFDASFWKLREARLTYALPLRFVPGFREHTFRASLVGRNLLAGARAPNIDPETALSTGVFRGFEMGQLPGTRSVGMRFSITP